MTLSELVEATYLKANGEVSTLTSTDAEYTKILQLANFYIGVWEREPGTDWNSLYSPEESLGTVTATSTYDIPDDYLFVSDNPGDYVRIDHSDGTNYTNFTVVPANELKRYYMGNKATPLNFVCAQIGQTLVFDRTFATTDPQYGGTIKTPIYFKAARLVNATDIVPVDDPNWLVLMVAADINRNDVTKQNQYPNLIAEASEAMKRMKENNDVSQDNMMFKVPIGGGVTW